MTKVVKNRGERRCVNKTLKHAPPTAKLPDSRRESMRKTLSNRENEAGVLDEKQGYKYEQVVKEGRSVLCEHNTISTNP